MPDKNRRENHRVVRDFEKAQPVGYEMPHSKYSSRNGIYVFAVVIFCLFALATGVVWYLVAGQVDIWTVLAALLVGLLFAYALRIAQQWEKVVVLRFGKFTRVAGPGFFMVIPFIESTTLTVDQRLMVTPFAAEQTLTRDLVAVDVDAVLFWMVWDARKACTEVEDYPKTVAWAAQTALRDAIGRAEISALIAERKQVDFELKDELDAKTDPWGITVVSVEIRDVRIPQELQDAMSAAAQAEQEKAARVTLAEIEKDISEMYVQAAHIYSQDDKALQLRTMNLIYESVKEKGGLVIAPSAFSEGFNNIESFVKGLKG
jgi:regulator of protease activity HflC (stomatin/prohibitin superfamily)